MFTFTIVTDFCPECDTNIEGQGISLPLLRTIGLPRLLNKQNSFYGLYVDDHLFLAVTAAHRPED